MKRSLVLLASVAVLAVPAGAQADPMIVPETVAVAHVQVAAQGQAGQRISLSDVVRRLRASRQGSMLDAREGLRFGRAVYVIVWEYPGGRIGNIYVDQRTGAVVGED